MSYIRNVYYNLMAIQNNIIINGLLIGHLFYPKYFKDKIIYYRNLGDTYYKYLLLLTLNDEIVKKYNIDLLNIGMGLYDKYMSIMNKEKDIKDENEEMKEMSDIDDMSEISEIEELMDIDDFMT
jgi:hypothetical protein